MFKVSDLVVYPSYGVARITSEIVKKIDTCEVVFFELNFISKDVKVLIPKSSCLNGEIRGLGTKEQVEEIFKDFFLPYEEKWFYNMSLVSWNRRGKEYQLKIRQGNLFELAKIYKDLRYVELFKVLSFGEKAILAQVEDLFCEEISFICQESLNDVVISVRNFINVIFYKNRYIEHCNVDNNTNFFNFLNNIDNSNVVNQ